MIKEVKFTGYSTVPSDYECEDGQLSTSFNLINEDNQLKPVTYPSPRDIGLNGGERLLFIHETYHIRHFIVVRTDADGTNPIVTWRDDKNLDYIPKPLLDLSGSGATLHQITAVGNTLLLLLSTGLQYFLWKEKDDDNPSPHYHHLGSHIPELPISFGLQAEMKRSDAFNISFGYKGDPFQYITEESQRTYITEQALAKVNKFIADESTSKGKFIFPFLVRYAYRLYDQSLIMHSAPVLMVCASGVTPRLYCRSLGYDSEDGHFNNAIDCRVTAPVCSLDYACLADPSVLDNWKDIVKSVDIFVSKPIYTYDQNGECTKFISIKKRDYGVYSICKHTNQSDTFDTETYPLRYQKNFFDKMYAFTFPDEEYGLFAIPARLEIPFRSDDAVKDDIRDNSQFYLLQKIRVEDLATERTLVPVKEDYLQSLVTREAMTDDYDSHDNLIPRQAFGYNSRINLSGISKTLFQGFDTGALFPYTDGFVEYSESDSPTYLDGVEKVDIDVYIKQEGKDIIVRNAKGTFASVGPLHFFYFPNINAYKAVIRRYRSTGYVCTLNLEPHGFLNGSFYFDGWADENVVWTDETDGIPATSSEADRTIDLFNKIYTSQVNNPFLFPALGINTVGTGEILGVSTAAKALSQGQFGQFPLYAFTTEGVWALEISSTGGYSARQPITRDVCINPDSITQLDSAVLFATDRGIMCISGSVASCISDAINAQFPFYPLSLPGISQLHSALGFSHMTNDDCLTPTDFTDFLHECSMLYDYFHQRVIVFSLNHEYAYIYSLRSHQWGMTYSRINHGVNSYPETLAVDHDGRLLEFSTDNMAVGQKSILITRPLKLDGPDILKTVRNVILRGTFRTASVEAAILYGSRNLFNWHLIHSSASHRLRSLMGSPYKYFRLACLVNLHAGEESIFGATVEFDTRLTGRLR